MKYLFCLLTVASLFGCIKEKNECPVYVNDIMPYSPLVFSIINADSLNLLENHSIDTTQISISDSKGTIHKFHTFLDSTNTKVRYISVPLQESEGTNELKISIKNVETSLKYDFRRVIEPCGSYSVYENYALNSITYQPQPKQTYFMHNKEKIGAVFRVIYIKQ